jgi:peptidoglycan/LPS O-acetylase OafA/YrhL
LAAITIDSPERQYRLDIDGLRSIAILSVVLFHAGISRFSGGFTGVDIFFVISGYLIGGHIFSEIHSNTFSFLRFYQRRAKRILPAFYLVLAFILLAALVLMSPYEAHQVGYNAIAATLSGTNILLWKINGYFDTTTRVNPLLMTWSLGVEEQFYAVIPVLMIVLARIRKNWMLPTVLCACLVSLLISQLELASHARFVFYMLPARAWELGAGVALAVFELSRKRITLTKQTILIVSLSGLTLMLVPVFLLSEHTPFPGVAALPSVLGTVLLLATPASWINRRLLSMAPFVFIGRVSYSWYLWHWPMLALMRLLHAGSTNELSIRDALLTVAAAFCLSVVSYYWLLARKWESVRFTRLSEKRRIRFSWRPSVAL